MSIDAIASAQAAATQSAASTASTALSSNYSMFLTLLTTQLQHQDPTDPMKSSEFTSQLVQYSSVEQQIQSNKNLESLITAVGNQNATYAVNLLGKQVTAAGTGASLSNGKATWGYNLASDASNVTINVVNSSGASVYSATKTGTAGAQSFEWDGKDANGTAQPDGTYFISVNANDATGNPVAATTSVSGLVTAVDFSSTTPTITVNGAQVAYSSVTGVSNPP